MEDRKQIALEIQKLLEDNFIGELNDGLTQRKARFLVADFLDRLDKKTITSYAVVSDESNNTPDIIDRNQFRLDTYIQEEGSSYFYKTMFLIGRREPCETLSMR